MVSATICMKQKSWELDIGNDHITYFVYSDYLKAKAKLNARAFASCTNCGGRGGFWSGDLMNLSWATFFFPCHNCGGRGMVDTTKIRIPISLS